MEDFEKWFLDILKNADISDLRYPIKGTAVWLPYGFKIRNYMLKIIRQLLEKDHEEVLFPLLIPQSNIAKERQHVKEFGEEVFWVTKAGKNSLNEKLALRPTSETAFYHMYALWVRSHIDLPIKYYQVVSTFRYEDKKNNPLLRVREITTFFEAHTAHSTSHESDNQIKEYIEIYKEFFDSLAIPYLISKRPAWDTFPVTEYTIAFDTITPNGKTLQIGTIHDLGQTFAKTFDISFEDKDGRHKFVHQTCAGLSDRVIGSIIAIHGDEKGLRLPPAVAPNQITVFSNEKTVAESMKIKSVLENEGLCVNIDDRDINMDEKYTDWQMKGTPLKLEVKSDEIIAERRDNGEIIELAFDDNLTATIKELLEKYKNNLSKTAWKRQSSHIKYIDNLDEIKDLVDSGNVVAVNWCGKEECGLKIEEITGCDILGIYKKVDKDAKCICSRKDAKYVSLLSNSY